MSQSASRNALASAVLTMLNDSLYAMTNPRTAYEYDKAPTTGGDYVAITLSRTFGGNQRGDMLSPSMWRLTVRAVGSVTNANVLLDRATTALEHQSVHVGAESSTGIRFESETDVEQDEDDLALWSGLRSFTFAF